MEEIKKSLDELVKRYQTSASMGSVANYIPELGKMDPAKLGISLVNMKGECVSSGDAEDLFTIQSISKPIVLLLALMDVGEDVVFSKVGKEPTGDAFNSIVRLETVQEHKPFNPMINAGAISISQLISGKNNQEKIERILAFTRKISRGSSVKVNQSVYQSEQRTGNRNRAMAYFLKDVGYIETEDVEEVVDLYFMQCAISMHTKELAYIGAVLANDGVDPISGGHYIPARYCRIAKSFMATCGMYDGSGEFAINVGIPAKSGVGGGIMGSIKNKYGVGVYGPALDKKGNSYAGYMLLEALSKKMDWTIY